MSKLTSVMDTNEFAQSSGLCVYSAAQAIVKSVLESETAIDIIAVYPMGWTEEFLRVCRQQTAAELLRLHSTKVVEAMSSHRAVVVAGIAAQQGKSAFAVIPSSGISIAGPLLQNLTVTPLHDDAALIVLFEDQPGTARTECPRHLAAELDIPLLEPCSVGELKQFIDCGIRLSRSGHKPVGVVAHRWLLSSTDTVVARLNRIHDPAYAIVHTSRHTQSRRLDPGSVERAIRRLELNVAQALPSPGERVEFSFITVGVAAASLAHLVHRFQLVGRVPTLRLGAVWPIDEAAVSRLLLRSERVMVLEPRSGTIERHVLDIAERLRSEGQRPATIWGRRVPLREEVHGSVDRHDDSDLHPSRLVRRVVHLLHMLRPGAGVQDQLQPDVMSGASIGDLHLDLGTETAQHALRTLLSDVEQESDAPLKDGSDGTVAPTRFIWNESPPDAWNGRTVTIEFRTRAELMDDALAIVRQLARVDSPTWLLVLDGPEVSPTGSDLERIMRGCVPSDRADRVTLRVVNLADQSSLRDAFVDCLNNQGLCIFVIHDGPPAQYDVSSLLRGLQELDAVGFARLQRILLPADRSCEFRSPNDSTSIPAGSEERAIRSSFTTTRISERHQAAITVRIRPLTEEVEVTRTRPPAAAWRSPNASRLPLPTPIHAQQGLWRAHLAGVRGAAPGVVGRVLVRAARSMGLAVRMIYSNEPIGRGLSSWTQVLFTQPREPSMTAPEPIPLSHCPMIPFGEADLLLGMNVASTWQAINPQSNLRVASSQQTYLVLNTDPLQDLRLRFHTRDDYSEAANSIEQVTKPDRRLIGGFAEAHRSYFHTDRGCDLSLLGAAFQSGFVPLTLDALNAALESLEKSEVGQARDAFELGRRLACDSTLFQPPSTVVNESVESLVRRITLAISRTLWGGSQTAGEFRRLIEHSLAATTPLTNSAEGRQARIDLVWAMYRCLLWGGLKYAQRYRSHLDQLIAADLKQNKFSTPTITQCGVLPIAELMLIRDMVYLASVAASPEHRLWLRRLLNNKHARGDEMQRRYLTRFEFVGFGRRIRLDGRTSDWITAIGSRSRHWIPLKWRGSKRERVIRDRLLKWLDGLHAAQPEFIQQYAAILSKLHQLAERGQLRSLTLHELDNLLGSTTNSLKDDASSPA